MNKAELVAAIAHRADLSQKDANAALSAALDVIMEALAEGDKVTLVGFGSFEPRTRQARDGRNPSTGQPIKIPATIVPAFAAGKAFKQALQPAPAKGRKKVAA